MIINGKEMSIKKNYSIQEFLLELNLNVDKVVVEVDGEIITKDNFTNIVLKENNIVEVISFVGGG